MVGMVRFELTASCSQSRRANQTTLHPENKTITHELFLDTWQKQSFTLSQALIYGICLAKRIIAS